MRVEIKETQDDLYVGLHVNTDLVTPIAIPNSSKQIELTGRLHRGNGKWRVWNDNYYMEVEEI